MYDQKVFLSLTWFFLFHSIFAVTGPVTMLVTLMTITLKSAFAVHRKMSRLVTLFAVVGQLVAVFRVVSHRLALVAVSIGVRRSPRAVCRLPNPWTSRATRGGPFAVCFVVTKPVTSEALKISFLFLASLRAVVF